MGDAVKRQVQVLTAAAGAGIKNCPAALARLARGESFSELKSPLVGAIAAFRIKGEKGFALFYGRRGQQYMMPMVKEGGTWKANQIAPLPYPLGDMQTE